ncbi:diguanylate cyclase [Thermomonas sp.]|uniref:sensor domain-containing diguanylate cyclase n=1 Tax=Thermomonas sp. TaxID=1971895 RepID=UPI0026324B88|nr:diguanylate cyclase [Thermomonas sp.]
MGSQDRHAAATGIDPRFADARAGSAWRESLTRVLVRIAREALQGAELDTILKGICDCLVAELPVPIASINLLDDPPTRFLRYVQSGELTLDASPIADGWPISRGISGRCVRLGVPQLVNNVHLDPDYIMGNAAVNSEYLVPIRHGTRMHGVLNIESRHADFFDAEACMVFDAVADLIAGAIHFARMTEELQQVNCKLETLSMRDGLTGIANRRHFDVELRRQWMRMAVEHQPLALLMVDADAFKALNDSRGHIYGDACLRELARACERLAGGDGMAARFGGEELAVLLPRRTLPEAIEIAETLRHVVEARALPHPASPVAACVTVSVGVAVLQPKAKDQPEHLIAQADRALYAAKQQGRNRVCHGSSGD